MFIESLSVSNYKCFHERTEVRLQPGINIIAGRNNSGKTTLLEALCLGAALKPFRSLRTVPNHRVKIQQPAELEARLVLSGTELQDLAYDVSDEVGIPLPDVGSALANQIGILAGHTDPEKGEIFRAWLLEQSRIDLHVALHGGTFKREAERVSMFREHVNAAPQQLLFLQLRSLITQPVMFYKGNPEHLDAGASLGQAFKNNIYWFRANRLTSVTPNFDVKRDLASDGANLTAVLDQLQRHGASFRAFNEIVSQVLPEVKHISVWSDSIGTGQVLVWMHDPSNEREDLAIPLHECGTGLAHVLAMAYLLVQKSNRIILIDEPQSFLHPGAARKLMEFLNSTKSQVILATHTPAIITATGARNVLVVRRRIDDSVVEELSMQKTANVQACLAELGASLSDVFGADSVLWVEGPTEELCLPHIIRTLIQKPLMGTVIRGVRATGDFDGRFAMLVVDVYSNLSQSTTLVPPVLGFLFDGEQRTPLERQDLKKRSQNKVHFTTRRMYENYLLHAGALAHLINQLDSDRPRAVTSDDVQPILDTERGSSDLESWYAETHGAEVISRVVAKLTDARVSYQKTRHGLILTEFIAENDPSYLSELVGQLRNILGWVADAEERN